MTFLGCRCFKARLSSSPTRSKARTTVPWVTGRKARSAWNQDTSKAASHTRMWAASPTHSLKWKQNKLKKTQKKMKPIQEQLLGQDFLISNNNNSGDFYSAVHPDITALVDCFFLFFLLLVSCYFHLVAFLGLKVGVQEGRGEEGKGVEKISNLALYAQSTITVIWGWKGGGSLVSLWQITWGAQYWVSNTSCPQSYLSLPSSSFDSMQTDRPHRQTLRSSASTGDLSATHGRKVCGV